MNLIEIETKYSDLDKGLKAIWPDCWITLTLWPLDPDNIWRVRIFSALPGHDPISFKNSTPALAIADAQKWMMATSRQEENLAKTLGVEVVQ